jgi:shikimate dehydrogenase
VTARRPEAAADAAALAGAATVAWADRTEAAAAAGLVVNATSVGMGDGASPLGADALHRGQVIADLVYHPLETPLLAAARAAGAVAVDGLGMLVHQAALQVERWAGTAAPVDEMRDAVRRALREPS